MGVCCSVGVCLQSGRRKKLPANRFNPFMTNTTEEIKILAAAGRKALGLPPAPCGPYPRLNEHQALLDRIKSQLPELTRYVEHVNKLEDPVYRFYHQSFKVYGLQEVTERMVAALADLAPEGMAITNKYFLKIIKDGTGKKWDLSHNGRAWMKHTRPIVEAFFHAKYMLNMAVKYGHELETAPVGVPSGWAALLYLYGCR